MWQRRDALMWPIIAAHVVVLPDPVGPVTRTSPRCSSAILRTAGGMFEGREVLRPRQDAAADDPDRATLAERVHAEAADAGDRVGEVRLDLVVEELALHPLVHHLAREPVGVGR